jgi:3-oxoacyl-[acyl-carrier protein] reductase
MTEESSTIRPEADGGRDRLAVVTGATGPLGRAIAHRFAIEGYRLALVGRRKSALDNLVTEIGSRLRGSGATDAAFAVLADLTEPGGAESAIGEAGRRYGRIDVLVNNAGGWSGSQLGPFAEKSETELRAELDNNLLSTVLASRAAVPAMLRHHYGRIVTVASVAGVIGLGGHAAYSAAKAGHLGLARQLAMELGGEGITTNCVAPGPVETPQVLELIQQGNPAIQAMVDSTPTGRLTAPSQVAEAVAFFASEAAGQINGQFLVIDGGMSAV